jgi:hypothetical protein
MKRSKFPKLVVRQETLRQLAGFELRPVRGGVRDGGIGAVGGAFSPRITTDKQASCTC